MYGHIGENGDNNIVRNKSNLIAGALALILILGTLFFLNSSAEQENSINDGRPIPSSNTAKNEDTKEKITSIEAYILSLKSLRLPTDGEFDKSKYREPLLVITKDINSFPRAVEKLCQALPASDSQICFTQAGVALFRSHPSDLTLLATTCSQLASPDTIGLNRTPNKFCGSGVFYSFFDLLTTALINKTVDISKFDLLTYCSKLNNTSSFPCAQEAGKFMANNNLITTVSALYHYCDPLEDKLLRDQCATGIGRGLAINEVNPIKVSFQKCLSVDFVDYSTKCFSSFGMVNDNTKLTDADFELCATQKFTTKSECQFSLGVYAFGQIHGDMHNLITYCAALSQQENYDYCMLGAYRTFIYNLKLIRDYQTANGFTELCHLDKEYQDRAFTQLCQAALISSLHESELEILNNSFLVQFCTTKGVLSCFQAIGYLAKRLGVSESALVKYCSSTSCKLGYQGNLAFLQKKLKIN